MNDTAYAYRQSMTRTASPLGLVIMLYDTAINSLRRAAYAMSLGDIETRTHELGHVITVLGQLQSTLNMEEGGEVAQQLQSYYSLLRSKVLEAAIKQSETILQHCIRHMCQVREAWQKVELDLTDKAMHDAMPMHADFSDVPALVTVNSAAEMAMSSQATSHWRA